MSGDRKQVFDKEIVRSILRDNQKLKIALKNLEGEKTMNKTKTTRLHIADMPADLQARAKAAAAMREITLKAWIKEAIQEKLDREKEGKS